MYEVSEKKLLWSASILVHAIRAAQAAAHNAAHVAAGRQLPCKQAHAADLHVCAETKCKHAYSHSLARSINQQALRRVHTQHPTKI